MKFTEWLKKQNLSVVFHVRFTITADGSSNYHKYGGCAGQPFYCVLKRGFLQATHEARNISTSIVGNGENMEAAFQDLVSIVEGIGKKCEYIRIEGKETSVIPDKFDVSDISFP